MGIGRAAKRGGPIVIGLVLVVRARRCSERLPSDSVLPV